MDGLEKPWWRGSETENNLYSMHFAKDICVSWKYFLFLKCLQAIYFSFYIKYAKENGYFGHIFLDVHTIQTVLNMSGLSTGVSFTYKMSS